MLLRNFFRRVQTEDGAVSVDWVVLTASVVAIGSFVGAVIWDKIQAPNQRTADYLNNATVRTSF